MVSIASINGAITSYQTYPQSRPKPRAGSRRKRAFIAPSLRAAHEILVAIADDLLPPGMHAFSEIREEFCGWCARMDVAPVSDKRLARWLLDHGFTKRRLGGAKVTVYEKKAT